MIRIWGRTFCLPFIINLDFEANSGNSLLNSNDSICFEWYIGPIYFTSFIRSRWLACMHALSPVIEKKNEKERQKKKKRKEIKPQCKRPEVTVYCGEGPLKQFKRLFNFFHILYADDMHIFFFTFFFI